MLFRSLFLLGVIWLTLPVGSALAEKADRQQPLHIQADTLRGDGTKKVQVFKTSVIVTQGTMVIRGEKMEISEDSQGYKSVVLTAEPGGRAFYRQKREGVDEFIEGEAEVIFYDQRTDTVRFTRRAELRQFRGETLAAQISGDRITYDSVADTFAADSDASGAAARKGRIKMMFVPKPNMPSASTPTPAASGAPLRPSTDLAIDKK